jgi:nucleoside phosphorylase
MIRDMEWRLVDAQARSDFDKLRADLSSAAVEVARGDWSALTATTEPSRTSRAITLLRRLMAPTVLAATAAALPHLPGLAATPTAIASIQVGLVAAAILTLISLDGSAQDRILNALGSAGGRSR